MEPQSEVPMAESAPPSSSLAGRLGNIFSSPGEVFAGLKGAAKSNGNWLVPLLLAIAVSIVTIFIVFSRPSIQQQMSDMQQQTMQKQVQAGKMTAEQAARAEEMMPKPGSMIWNIFGIVGAAVVNVIILLLAALLFWLIGKFAFHAPLGYGLSLEAVGLSYMVMILGSVISILTILALDSMHATPSPAIFIKEFNVDSGVDKFLSQMNVFSIWFASLLGIGLAKLTGAATSKALIWTLGIFLLFSVVVSFVF